MSDTAFALLGLGLFALVALPIVVTVRAAFRRHDPARGRAMCEVGDDGAFELQVHDALGGEVYFRFEIEGDTDADYDLVLRGVVDTIDGAAERSFAWRTAERSLLTENDGTERVLVTRAVSSGRGSIELAALPRSPCRVKGRVDARPRTLLRRGWVYAPRDV